MIIKTLFLVINSLLLVLGKNNLTIKFIKSFIDNEGKPSLLMYDGLCWGKHFEVLLVNELSKSGTRCSASKPAQSRYQDHILLFMVDLECSQAKEVLVRAASDQMFQFPYRWLVLSNVETVNPVNTTLWEMPLLIDSDLVLAERKGETFHLTELHRPSMNHSMQLTPRGSYYNGTFVDTRVHKELARRRKDLMGHPITMANVVQDSNDTKEHLVKEDRLDLQNDAVAKMCWICAKYAFEMLNATPQYIFSYRWGYKVNGQWSGMINDIKTRKADLGTNCYLNAERFDVITYIDLLATLRVRFIFRQPPLAYVSNIFSMPFSNSVWVAIAVCTAASAATLYLISKWEASLETSPTLLDGSISDAVLLTVSAVAQQGCFIEPRRVPGRIMEWFLFASLMALYAAYSANIVVLLQTPSNSIRSLAQLATSKITLAANDVDYNRFVMSSYKDPVHVKIYRRIFLESGKPQLHHIDDGVERIRQGLYAFHSIVEPVYRRIEQTFLETEKCDLSEVDFINGFDAFTPIKKDSPYLEIIRVAFKQVRESGIQSALSKRFLVPKPHCSNKVSAFSSVGLLDMRPVLVFMVYGIIVSLLIFMAEIVYFRLNTYRSFRRLAYKKHRNHKKNAWR